MDGLDRPSKLITPIRPIRPLIRPPIRPPIRHPITPIRPPIRLIRPGQTFCD